MQQTAADGRAIKPKITKQSPHKKIPKPTDFLYAESNSCIPVFEDSFALNILEYHT